MWSQALGLDESRSRRRGAVRRTSLCDSGAFSAARVRGVWQYSSEKVARVSTHKYQDEILLGMSAQCSPMGVHNVQRMSCAGALREEHAQPIVVI